MSCPICDSSDEALLERILYNMRYANPHTIDRFLKMYRLGKKVFNERPGALRDYMAHMFGPGQGGCAHDLFIAIREEQAEATA